MVTYLRTAWKHLDSYQLQTFRSTQFNRLQRLEAMETGFFVRKECDKIRDSIQRIDAELEARINSLNRFL